MKGLHIEFTYSTKKIKDVISALAKNGIQPEFSPFNPKDFLGVFENVNLNITVSSKKEHCEVYMLATRKHFLRMPKFLDSVGRLQHIITKMPNVKKVKMEEIE